MGVSVPCARQVREHHRCLSLRTLDTKAAKRFLGKALRGWKDWELTVVLNTDKAPTDAAAIAELKAKGFEVMAALRKSQAGLFSLECAFGMGPCALSVAVALVRDCLAGAES